MAPDHSEVVDVATRSLDRKVANSNVARTRLQRLMRMPLKLAMSKSLRSFARARRKAVRVRARTFWGGRMCVVIPEPVSVNILEHGYIEEGLTRTMLAILRPGMVLFDVGAHFGYYSMLGSWLVGPTGRVVSFEPTPSSLEVLRANTDALENADVEGVAVWSSEGSRIFTDFGSEFSAFNSFFGARLEEQGELSGTTFSVKTVSIDDYAERTSIRPDVVKVDAESSEMQVLQGMVVTLKEVRPALTLEAGDVGVEGAATTADYITFLEGFGYVPFECSDRVLRRHAPRDRYAHLNLLFLPEERSAEISVASR